MVIQYRVAMKVRPSIVAGHRTKPFILDRGDLKIMKTSTKFALSAAIIAAIGFSVTANAMDFKVSGQIDKAIIAADNGEDTDVGFVDNDGSNSRFRFVGSQDMGNGLTMGFNYEIALRQNLSDAWDINEREHDDGTSDVSVDTRHVNVFLQGDFGRFTLGKGSMASDGTSDVNYSGTAFLGGGHSLTDYAAGISYMTDNGADSGYNIGSFYDYMDGASRHHMIRYDTPSLGGLVLSTSYSQGHGYDFAARYETGFGNGGKFGAAVSYWNNGTSGDDVPNNGDTYNVPPIPYGGHNVYHQRFDEIGGSASVLLPNGLNFSGIYKERNASGGSEYVDGKFYSLGVGYKFGKNNIELNVAQTKWDGDKGNAGLALAGKAADEVKATHYGLAYLYNWTDSVELYASYHKSQVDISVPGAKDPDLQDIDFIYAGTRVKFF